MIAFIKRPRSQSQFYHCDMTVQVMKVLADENLKEEMRFGYVDIHQDEFLKETFDVKTVPALMFIKDARVYEAPMF